MEEVAGRLSELVVGHRAVGRAEVHGACGDLPDPAAATDGLIVEAGTLIDLRVLVEPLRVDRIREGRAGAVHQHLRGDRLDARAEYGELRAEQARDPSVHPFLLVMLVPAWRWCVSMGLASCYESVTISGLGTGIPRRGWQALLSGDAAARMIPSHDARHETRPLPRLGRHARGHEGQPDARGRRGQPYPYAERGKSPGARAPTLRRVFHRVESATRRDGRDQRGRGRPPLGLGERAARSPLYRLAALSPHGRGWLRLPQAQTWDVPRARASLWRRSGGLDARRRCGEGPRRRGRGGRRELCLGARLYRRRGPRLARPRPGARRG